MQSLENKTKLKSCQNISNYYDEMIYHRQNATFQFTEDPSNRKAQDTGIVYLEVLLVTKFSENKFQVKKIKINFLICIILLLKIEKKKCL